MHYIYPSFYLKQGCVGIKSKNLFTLGTPGFLQAESSCWRSIVATVSLLGIQFAGKNKQTKQTQKQTKKNKRKGKQTTTKTETKPGSFDFRRKEKKSPFQKD